MSDGTHQPVADSGFVEDNGNDRDDENIDGNDNDIDKETDNEIDDNNNNNNNSNNMSDVDEHGKHNNKELYDKITYDYRDGPLFGREQEVELLRHIYHYGPEGDTDDSMFHDSTNSSRSFKGLRRTRTQSMDATIDRAKATVVIISGPPGCGKTALAESVLEDVEDAGGAVLKWKFDPFQYRQLEVGRGFLEGIEETIDKIFARAKTQPDILEYIRRRMTTMYTKAEKEIILNEVPEWVVLFENDGTDDDGSSVTATETDPKSETRGPIGSHRKTKTSSVAGSNRSHDTEASTRPCSAKNPDDMNLATTTEIFRRLLSVFSTPERPGMFFVGDVNFADPTVMYWLSTVFHDSGVAGALIVLTCTSFPGATSEEDPYGHEGLIGLVKGLEQDKALNVVRIDLAANERRLSDETYEQILSTALSVTNQIDNGSQLSEPPIDIKSITKTVRAHAGDSIRFAVDLAKEAVIQGVGTREDVSMEQIIATFMTHEELIMHRLSTMPQALLKFVMVWSCLGHWQYAKVETGFYGPDGAQLHNEAVRRGIIRRGVEGPYGPYRFASNVLQVAANNFVHQGDPDTYYYRLGRKCWRYCVEKEKRTEDEICQTLTLLYCGRTCVIDQEER